MSFTVESLHKMTALAVAVVVTLGVQGSMLAGFDHLATNAPLNFDTTCKAGTLPTLEMVHARS